MLGILCVAFVLFGGMLFLGLCEVAVEKLYERGAFEWLFGEEYLPEEEESFEPERMFADKSAC